MVRFYLKTDLLGWQPHLPRLRRWQFCSRGKSASFSAQSPFPTEALPARQAGVAQLGRAMAAGEAEVDAALRRANELHEATAVRRTQEARHDRLALAS